MIYFEDKEIQIRDMAPEDARTITDEEVAQGWDTRRSSISGFWKNIESMGSAAS